MSLTEEQLAARKYALGGSDAPVALGLSKWRTPLDLYLEKVGVPSAFEENEKMRWGNVLEPVIRSEWAQREGKIVNVIPTTQKCVERPFMVANVDGLLLDEDAGLEIKTVSGGAVNDWGEPMTDEIPEYYLVQVYHYAFVTRVPKWYVAALFNGSELRTYVVDVDWTLANEIADREAAFWKHVETRTPPDAATNADLSRLFPRDTGRTVEATSMVLSALDELASARARRDDDLADVEKWEVIVKSFMGDAQKLVHDGKLLATWKSAAPASRIDLDALRRDVPTIASKYTVTGEGSRRFLLKN